MSSRRRPLRTPSVSIRNTSLSAVRRTATCVATSSSDRLKISPVGEYPSGEISTMSPSSTRCWIASTSTRRTSPVSCMSTPSITPSGFAVMKLPLDTLMRAPAIGEFAIPSESIASMRLRTWPEASSTQSIVSASVTRRPNAYRFSMFCCARIASICGREPCTTTRWMPRLCSRLRSCTMPRNVSSATTSPPKAITNVLPRNAWM